MAPLVEVSGEGRSLAALRALVEERLAPHLVRYDHPGFHSLYNFLPEEGAALGAEIALAWNQGVTNWQVSPGGVTLERLLCDALRRLFGFPDGAGATFMYSGTYANHQALYLALTRGAERRGVSLAREGLAGFGDPSRLAVVASEEAHFSVRQTVRMLGLGEEALVPVETDGRGRLDPGALGRAVAELLAAGREPVAVVLTAGTSSTGALDPLEASVDALEEALGEGGGGREGGGAGPGIPWIHLDGAYGLAFRLLPEFDPYFRGLERVDSASWDPHKQLGVPIPSSVLFARRDEDLLRMAVHGDYFNRPGEEVPNPGLRSPPSTRPLSALPVAAAFLHGGLEGVRERLRAPLEAMSAFAARASREPAVEVVSEPELAIACLRIRPEGAVEAEVDALQEELFRRTAARGERSVSLTAVDGRPVLRFLVVAPTSTADSMMETLAYLRALAEEIRG